MSLFDSVFNEVPKNEEKKNTKKNAISSTAGAIPVKNAKGEITMETVKVKRYVAGKIPDYADEKIQEPEIPSNFDLKTATPTEQRHMDHGRRNVYEPRIIHAASQAPQEPETTDSNEMDARSRRQMLRERILKQETLSSFVKNEINEPEQLKSDPEMEESNESSEYTSESECEAIPLLKPVFVPKNNRITIQQDEEQLEQLNQLKFEEEALKRRHETKEIIAQLIMEDTVKENNIEGEENVVITDDDDEETAYEEWKIRELKRMTRNSEEAETFEAEKREIQRLRLMTEEERQAHLAANPKFITNQAEKGEYKFLQKYYHRGAFYLDKDEDVLKQNFAQPTLEDHFDKSTLPEVMRVKNFGKPSRTKYTHLVDQDTSCFEGAWSKKNELSGVFSAKIGGGMKQTFERPATKRRKYN